MCCIEIMPKTRPSKRKERHKELHENYLAGRASRPHQHTPNLKKSFSNDEQENDNASPSTATTSATVSAATEGAVTGPTVS